MNVYELLNQVELNGLGISRQISAEKRAAFTGSPVSKASVFRAPAPKPLSIPQSGPKLTPARVYVAPPNPLTTTYPGLQRREPFTAYYDPSLIDKYRRSLEQRNEARVQDTIDRQEVTGAQKREGGDGYDSGAEQVATTDAAIDRAIATGDSVKILAPAQPATPNLAPLIAAIAAYFYFF